MERGFLLAQIFVQGRKPYTTNKKRLLTPMTKDDKKYIFFMLCLLHPYPLSPPTTTTTIIIVVVTRVSTAETTGSSTMSWYNTLKKNYKRSCHRTDLYFTATRETLSEGNDKTTSFPILFRFQTTFSQLLLPRFQKSNSYFFLVPLLVILYYHFL